MSAEAFKSLARTMLKKARAAGVSPPVLASLCVMSRPAQEIEVAGVSGRRHSFVSRIPSDRLLPELCEKSRWCRGNVVWATGDGGAVTTITAPTASEGQWLSRGRGGSRRPVCKWTR